MFRKIGMYLPALLWVCASTVLASAQAASSPTAIQASTAPVACVYVSRYISSTGNNQVNWYAAGANLRFARKGMMWRASRPWRIGSAS